MERPARAGCIAALPALACAALLALACAPKPPDYVLAPGHEGAPGVKRVVTTPVNLVVSLSDELEPVAETVDEEVAAYLGSKDREVTRLRFSSARRLWEASVATVKASGTPLSFESTARAFALALHEKLEFDALVMPSLVEGLARIKSRTATWDGVKRQIPVIDAPNTFSDRYECPPAHCRSWEFSGGFSGDVGVVSLHVVVFDAEGNRVFRSQGGLDFTRVADFTIEDLESRRYHMRPRDDLFDDPANLRDGIEVAFDPYLPKPVPVY